MTWLSQNRKWPPTVAPEPSDESFVVTEEKKQQQECLQSAIPCSDTADSPHPGLLKSLVWDTGVVIIHAEKSEEKKNVWKLVHSLLKINVATKGHNLEL